jgi:hypothetical protein
MRRKILYKITTLQLAMLVLWKILKELAFCQILHADFAEWQISYSAMLSFLQTIASFGKRERSPANRTVMTTGLGV